MNRTYGYFLIFSGICIFIMPAVILSSEPFSLSPNQIGGMCIVALFVLISILTIMVGNDAIEGRETNGEKIEKLKCRIDALEKKIED